MFTEITPGEDMKTDPTAPKTIDEYIAGFPYDVQEISVRFPLDKPIPFDLISQIVKLRVKENLGRAEAKGKKK